MCLHTPVSTLCPLHMCLHTPLSTLCPLHMCLYTPVSTLCPLHVSAHTRVYPCLPHMCLHIPVSNLSFSNVGHPDGGSLVTVESANVDPKVSSRLRNQTLKQQGWAKPRNLHFQINSMVTPNCTRVREWVQGLSVLSRHSTLGAERNSVK